MKSNDTVRPKIGLALGSGGARGLAHIGVIKILHEHKIPIDFIAGSSIGALIGAHYAKFKDPQLLEDFALSFNKRKGFALFDPTFKGGLIKGNKIESLISELYGTTTIEELDIPFTAIATDFNSAEPVCLDQGDLAKAIRASLSVPAVFQPVTSNGRILADGGLSNPIPVDIVRSKGANIVIAVNLDTVYIDETEPSVPSLSSTPLHSINILRHHLALHTARTADIIIAPNVSHIGLIGWNYFFDGQKAQQVIAEGERAAKLSMDPISDVIKSYTVKHATRKGFVDRIKQYFTFYKQG